MDDDPYAHLYAAEEPIKHRTYELYSEDESDDDDLDADQAGSGGNNDIDSQSLDLGPSDGQACESHGKALPPTPPKQQKLRGKARRNQRKKELRRRARQVKQRREVVEADISYHVGRRKWVLFHCARWGTTPEAVIAQHNGELEVLVRCREYSKEERSLLERRLAEATAKTASVPPMDRRKDAPPSRAPDDTNKGDPPPPALVSDEAATATTTTTSDHNHAPTDAENSRDAQLSSPCAALMDRKRKNSRTRLCRNSGHAVTVRHPPSRAPDDANKGDPPPPAPTSDEAATTPTITNDHNHAPNDAENSRDAQLFSPCAALMDRKRKTSRTRLCRNTGHAVTVRHPTSRRPG